MPAEAIFSDLTFEQVIAQIFARRRISPLDQQLLTRALQPGTLLTQKENTAISKVFEALQSGGLRVVD